MFKPRLGEHSSIRQLKRILLRLFFAQTPEMDRLSVALSHLEKLPSQMREYLHRIEGRLELYNLYENPTAVSTYQTRVRVLLKEHIYTLDETFFTITEELLSPSLSIYRYPYQEQVAGFSGNTGIVSSTVPSTAPSPDKEERAPAHHHQVSDNHFEEYRVLLLKMMLQVKPAHWIYQHLLLLEEENYYVSSETLTTLEELNNSDEFTRFLNGKTDSATVERLLLQLEVNYESMLIHCCSRKTKKTPHTTTTINPAVETEATAAAHLRHSTIRLVVEKISTLGRQANAHNESVWLTAFQAVLKTAIILVDEILPPDDAFHEEVVTEHLLPLMSPSLWGEFLGQFTGTDTPLRMRPMHDFLCAKVAPTYKVKPIATYKVEPTSTTAITREIPPVVRQEMVHLRPNTPLSPLPPPSSDKRVSLTGARRRYHGYYDDSDDFGEVRPRQRYYGNNYRRRPLMAPELSSRPASPLVKPTDEASFKAAIEEIVDTIPSVNYEKDIDGILRLYEGVKRLDGLFASSCAVNRVLQDSLMVRLLEKMSLKRVDAFERYCKGTRTLSRLRQWLKRVTVSAQSYAYPGYCALAQRKSGIPSMAYWFPPMTLETGRTIHTKIGVRQK